MRKNEIHALRNIMQGIIGFAEMGQPHKVIQAVRDASAILGRHPETVPWAGKKHTLQLSEGYNLSVESLTDKEQNCTIYLQISSKTNTMGLALPCTTARDLADLILSYCDLIELQVIKKK